MNTEKLRKGLERESELYTEVYRIGDESLGDSLGDVLEAARVVLDAEEWLFCRAHNTLQQTPYERFVDGPVCWAEGEFETLPQPHHCQMVPARLLIGGDA